MVPDLLNHLKNMQNPFESFKWESLSYPNICGLQWYLCPACLDVSSGKKYFL